MTTVKVRDCKVETTESHLHYPIYLHYQDEDCHDEYQKITEKGTISIKNTHFGCEITTNSINTVNSNYLKNLSKEIHFNEALKQTLKYINTLSKSDKVIKKISYKCCATYDCKNRDNLTWLCHKNTNCISQIK